MSLRLLIVLALVGMFTTTSLFISDTAVAQESSESTESTESTEGEKKNEETEEEPDC